MEYQKYNKIILLNSKGEADAYLMTMGHSTLDDLHTLIIALSPLVQAHLRKKGIKFINTLPYFTNNSHKIILEKSECVMQWLKKNFILPGDSHFSTAYRRAYLFYLRFSLHHFFWLIEIVTHAITNHNPRIIMASVGTKQKTSSRYSQPTERFLGQLVQRISALKGVHFQNLHVKEEEVIYGKITFWNTLLGELKTWSSLIKIIFENTIKSWKLVQSDGRDIYYTSPNYQMGRLVEELKTKYVNKKFRLLKGPVIFTNWASLMILYTLRGNYKLFKERRTVFRDLYNNIHRQKHLFSHHDVLFLDLLIEKIRTNESYTIGLMAWGDLLLSLVVANRPSAILSIGSRADDHIVSEICLKRNIPAILISHGSHVPPKNIYETIEWRDHSEGLLLGPFTHLALQSPLAEKHLYSFSEKKSIIKTGPLIWGLPINKHRSDGLFHKFFAGYPHKSKLKIVVHAGTPKTSNSLRLHVYETPDEYLQSIIDLSHAIHSIPNVVLIVKFRPVEEVDSETLASLIPFSQKVLLSTEESMSDVLGVATLLVSFSSTVIEEALQNKIPVLLYGAGGRYQHILGQEVSTRSPKPLLPRSPVYYLRNRESLKVGLENILSILPSDEDNRIFDQYIYPEGERESLLASAKP